MFYPIDPMAAPRLTNRDRWKKRPVVMAYFAFRDEVRARGVVVPIPSKVTFWMPMPKSWSAKKRREMDAKPHLVRPDLSNMLKALEDAVFDEDAAVWSIWPEKRWSSRPGIEVRPVGEWA
jgi:Holliday junction resolvase RusA-like endonuclease